MQGHVQSSINYDKLREYGFIPLDKEKRTTGAHTFFSTTFFDAHEIKRLVYEEDGKNKISHECFDISNKNDQDAFLLVNVYLRNAKWKTDYYDFGDTLTDFRTMRDAVVICGDFNWFDKEIKGFRHAIRKMYMPVLHDVVEIPIPETCHSFSPDGIFSSVETRDVDVNQIALPPRNRHLHRPIFFKVNTSEITIPTNFAINPEKKFVTV